MANREKKKVVTKKYVARVEKEELQRRYLLIGSIAVISTVIFLIVYGIVVEGLIKPNQPIIEVNGTEISTEKYQTWVRYQRYQLTQQYMYYLQLEQSFGAESASFFQNYRYQIETQLDPNSIGASALNFLIEDILIREEADRLEISVSQDEIDTYIAENFFSYYPDGTPIPEPTKELQPTSTLSPLQKTVVDSPLVDESATSDSDIEDTPTPLPTTIPPTPTAYTRDAFSENYENQMKDFKLSARVTEEDLFWIIETQLLREKVMDTVIENPPVEEEQVWAHHILFRDQEMGLAETLGFIARIEAGEDFKTVAEEFAVTPEGEEETIRYEDLGWFGKNQMVTEFEEAAYALEIGEISEPVQTSFGWHVIQVVGREVRPLDETTIEQQKQTDFQDWLAELRAEADVEFSEDWIKSVPTEPDIPEQLKLLQQQ